MPEIHQAWVSSAPCRFRRRSRKAHRLQITRPHLAGDFGVAFDLALYSLCIDLFDRFRHHPRPLELRATESAPRSSLNDLSGTPADRLIEAQGCALDLDWLKLPPAEREIVLGLTLYCGRCCTKVSPSSRRRIREKVRGEEVHEHSELEREMPARRP
jgi:hypothetical protein